MIELDLVSIFDAVPAGFELKLHFVVVSDECGNRIPCMGMWISRGGSTHSWVLRLANMHAQQREHGDINQFVLDALAKLYANFPQKAAS